MLVADWQISAQEVHVSLQEIGVPLQEIGKWGWLVWTGGLLSAGNEQAPIPTTVVRRCVLFGLE